MTRKIRVSLTRFVFMGISWSNFPSLVIKNVLPGIGRASFTWDFYLFLEEKGRSECPSFVSFFSVAFNSKYSVCQSDIFWGDIL